MCRAIFGIKYLRMLSVKLLKIFFNTVIIIFFFFLDVLIFKLLYLFQYTLNNNSGVVQRTGTKHSIDINVIHFNKTFHTSDWLACILRSN